MQFKNIVLSLVASVAIVNAQGPLDLPLDNELVRNCATGVTESFGVPGLPQTFLTWISTVCSGCMETLQECGIDPSSMKLEDIKADGLSECYIDVLRECLDKHELPLNAALPKFPL